MYKVKNNDKIYRQTTSMHFQVITVDYGALKNINQISLVHGLANKLVLLTLVCQCVNFVDILQSY